LLLNSSSVAEQVGCQLVADKGQNFAGVRHPWGCGFIHRTPALIIRVRVRQ